MRMGLRHVLIAVVALVPLVLAACGQGNVRTFRYRLTVELDVRVEPRTASSIIEARYLLGNRDGNGLRWHSTIRGVVPVFDLGADGTFMPALQHDAGDLQSRQPEGAKPFGQYRMPFDAAGIPLGAYHLAEPDTIETMRGTAVLEPNDYPIFVWIPPSGDWHAARQMFADEIAARATPNIRVTRITVEAAPKVPVLTKIEPAPQWLVEIRDYFDVSDYGEKYFARIQKDNWGNRFKLSTGYIERGVI